VSASHSGKPEASGTDRRSSLAVIIPARYDSSRFPGKPLHLLAGKEMIRHVWERACQARLPGRVMIATDDQRIATVAKNCGAEVILTRADHPTGSDRIAEVADQFPEITHWLNVQGDEPLVDPQLIDQLGEALLADDAPPMVTAATPRHDPRGLSDPNIVKVVCNRAGDALYFSRSPIPHCRHAADGRPKTWLQHHGIYGYHRDLLLQFVAWPPTALEKDEFLEQLRMLEHGVRIGVILADNNSPGVDTPEQAAEIEKILLSSG